MTLRSPEDRATLQAAAKVRQRERRERKAAAAQHIRALVASKAPNKRQPRERDNGYLAWLRRQPCAVCGSTPCDAAHLRFANPSVGRTNPGMGCKPHDRHATALCREHHTEQHAAGNEARWWASKGIDPDRLSARLYAAYLAAHEAPAVIRRKGEES